MQFRELPGKPIGEYLVFQTIPKTTQESAWEPANVEMGNGHGPHGDTVSKPERCQYLTVNFFESWCWHFAFLVAPNEKNRKKSFEGFSCKVYQRGSFHELFGPSRRLPETQRSVNVCVCAAKSSALRSYWSDVLVAESCGNAQEELLWIARSPCWTSSSVSWKANQGRCAWKRCHGSLEVVQRRTHSCTSAINASRIRGGNPRDHSKVLC